MDSTVAGAGGVCGAELVGASTGLGDEDAGVPGAGVRVVGGGAETAEAEGEAEASADGVAATAEGSGRVEAVGVDPQPARAAAINTETTSGRARVADRRPPSLPPWRLSSLSSLFSRLFAHPACMAALLRLPTEGGT
ncbi:hypothetical protein OG914_26805 [Streptomyces sp. NBC_00291]|uniref:hypothetical protein n=1 Tax=Streptomyces sp. NBC_00291 TaxID=2975704 RepID=UPI00224F6408|nr:hypothetical protein [Streptomyces sp. NBC_00291]MCX5157598.1 hypothetical protein [Streptomyces sp. NBC_00291]